MISLIVPCYNEQESLPIFYKEATKVVGNIKQEYELIFINDGSKDKTLEVMKKIAREVYFIFKKLWKRSCNVCWFL